MKAPDEIHERLMRQIHGDKTAEEKELIALGRIYKKRRKQYKYVAVAAALVGVFAISITSLGGPERIIQTMRRMIGEREQTHVDLRGDKVTDSGISKEEKAYQTIKDKFGVEAVRFLSMPSDMHFVEAVVEEETQNARLYYENGKGKTLICTMWFNYRTVTTGVDVEDEIIETQEMIVDGNTVFVKRYEVKNSEVTRWRVEFQHQKVQYFVGVTDFSSAEIEKIVKNLKFF